jgi:hypothetical protein
MKKTLLWLNPKQNRFKNCYKKGNESSLLLTTGKLIQEEGEGPQVAATRSKGAVVGLLGGDSMGNKYLSLMKSIQNTNI